MLVNNIPLLTRRFEEALLYATRLHAQQVRKGSHIPYVSHLLSVAALVLEMGGNEDQVIAALLHDAIEDQGGLETREAIRAQFGDNVVALVEGCTDSYTLPKKPWRERKQQYLERLKTASPEVRCISLADKLHNARSILMDAESLGNKVWEKFHGGKEGSLWYYHSLLNIYEQQPNYWTKELERIVATLENV